MSEAEIKLILKRWGVTESHPKFEALVSALHHAADERVKTAYRSGQRQAGLPDTQQRRTDFEEYARLSTTDPEAAAVYFQRATGKHLLRFSNHVSCNRFIR